MKNALILFTLALAMLNLAGCATAITSYNVSYGDDSCPLKWTPIPPWAYRFASMTTQLNANNLKIMETNYDQKSRDGHRSMHVPRRLHQHPNVH